MRNIRRPTEREPLFKRFTDIPHPDSERPIFTTQRDFLCFAAVLGFHAGERTSLGAKSMAASSTIMKPHEISSTSSPSRVPASQEFCTQIGRMSLSRCSRNTLQLACAFLTTGSSRVRMTISAIKPF